MRTSLTTSNLHLTWPDGTSVLTGLDLALGPGRHALVGDNGTGKSTLLRLLAGELAPTVGSVAVEGRVAYLAQRPTLEGGSTVAETLGVAAALNALRAIEGGSTDPADFEAVGDDWDVEERAQAHLDRLGLGRLDPDRLVATLSGGEQVLLRLTSLLLRRPTVLLLDEPTNNLDGPARDRLHHVVTSWPHTLLVVSHDRELLRLVDDVGELRRTHEGTVLRWYGGDYDDYVIAVALEQEAARRAVAAAEGDVRRQKRELAAAQVVLARRERYGRRMNEQKREPKIVMGARQRAAQESAGTLRGMHTDRLDQARESLDEARRRVHDDPAIRIDLPATAVPTRREVLTLDGVLPAFGDLAEPLDLVLRGPERVGLTGPNGIGKTSVLRCVLGTDEPRSGTVRRHVPVRHLPQRVDLLDPDRTIADNVAAFAPGAEAQEIRSALARFGFRGRAADQPVASLSGGELLRATLAALLLAEPAPQLLVLDEPTNNLDLASVGRLVEALASYRGALLVVSHDPGFLADLALDRVVDLGAEVSPARP